MTEPSTEIGEAAEVRDDRATECRSNQASIVSPETTTLARATLGGALVTVALAHGLWVWLGPVDSAAYLRENRAPVGTQAAMVDVLLGVALVTVVVFVAGNLIGRINTSRLFHGVRVAAPLALMANMPLLLEWRAWHDRDFPFFGFVLVAMMALVWCIDRATRAGVFDQLEHLTRRLSRKAPLTGWLDSPHLGLIVVAVCATAYAAFMAVVTVRYHLNGYTSSYDLGIEENIVWQTLHGGPLFKCSPVYGPEGTHFGRHATFIAFVVAPFYAIYQHAETLLVFEAVVVGAASIPLFIYARRYVGQGIAALLAIAYLMHPAVHGAQLYDFHFLTLTPFFIWMLVLAIDRRWWVTAGIFVLLTLSIREDVAAAMVGLGLFFLLSSRSPRVGLALAIVGLTYFGVIKFAIMPQDEGTTFLWMFEGLLPPGTREVTGIPRTLVGNPMFTLGTILTPEKLLYALQLMVPLAMLPLRRIETLPLLLPGLVFTLLVTQPSAGVAPAPNQLSYQYTMHWIPYIFVGAVWVLGEIKRAGDHRRLQCLIGAVALGSLLVSYQYGAILQHNTARAGVDMFRFETSDEDMALRKARAIVLRQVPPDAKVSASERIVPHVSNRDNAYTLRRGVFDAEWIVVSFGSPLCRRSDHRTVKRVLREKSFGVIAVKPPFAVLRRGAPTDKNEQLGRLLRRRR